MDQIDQKTAPTQKIAHAGMVAGTAGGVGAAIVTVIVWLLSLKSIVVPADVALAMGTIIVAALGLVLHRNLSKSTALPSGNAAPAAVDPRTPLDSAASPDAPAAGVPAKAV